VHVLVFYQLFQYIQFITFYYMFLPLHLAICLFVCLFLFCIFFVLFCFALLDLVLYFSFVFVYSVCFLLLFCALCLLCYVAVSLTFLYKSTDRCPPGGNPIAANKCVISCHHRVEQIKVQRRKICYRRGLLYVLCCYYSFGYNI